MNAVGKQFEHLSDFDNTLVVDNHGKIVFFDLADLNVLKELGHRPEDFLGAHITSSFQNLTPENSTIIRVLQTGEAMCNVRQELITVKGSVFVTYNSTYPIKDNEGNMMGAIEFSKHYFMKEDIQSLRKYAGHKIYRKNNTIYTIDDMISVSAEMEAIKKKMQRVAKTDSSVLIYGRTGTGKEVVAQAIHNLSDRFEKPFISLNCGAIPATLLESTLFGTTKGSFTGSEDMPGLFEQAQGGTLFLDEINSMEMNLQVKLLKAVEEKVIRRVGGKTPISLNIRVISATNEDPDVLVVEKRLREDLFYRLGIVQIDLPNLTERREDIEPLTRSFIEFYNSNMSTYVEDIAEDVLACFRQYDWPGNIRELKNAVETAYHNTTTGIITMEDLPRRIQKKVSTSPAAPADGREPGLKERVEAYEKDIIVRELNAANGRIAETARRLGLSKQSLKYKLDKYMLR